MEIAKIISDRYIDLKKDTFGIYIIFRKRFSARKDINAVYFVEQQ